MDIKYKKIGTWWSDIDIDLIQLEDGKIYALYDWDGQGYANCWEVGGDWNMDVLNPKKTYSITPVYDWDHWNEEEETFLTDSGEEWDGIVDYSVYEN